VLTICFADGNDCQVWVPERWEGTNVPKELAKCESFAFANYNHSNDMFWQCVEEGHPLENGY
jgi:hypothetical protein